MANGRSSKMILFFMNSHNVLDAYILDSDIVKNKFILS